MGHGLGCDDGSCIHSLVSAAWCSCILCSLSSGRLVYGAFVAAVVATEVSLLAWAAVVEAVVTEAARYSYILCSLSSGV